MRDLIEKEIEDILTYGCSAHLLNLLAHDMEIPNVTKHVLQIVKYFRNNHHASARYRAEGGKCLIMPQEVRWNTMNDCCDAYLESWHILSKICDTDREKIDLNIRNKVSNIGLKHNVEDLVARLKPIAAALDKMQSDTCHIGDAVHIWKDLKDHLPNQRDIMKKYGERYNQAITPAHLLAYLLHPSHRGALLSDAEKNTAYEYAAEKPGKASTVTQFEAKAPPFSTSKFLNEVTSRVSPLVWFMSHGDSLPEEFLNLVKQLFTAVASSAGAERIFSSFGLVHSKLRNRLGTEKAAKLVFLYKAMNQDRKATNHIRLGID